MGTKTERVRDELRNLILADYVPGQALLPERELELRFGVSRVTIRRAVDGLEAEGLVHRVRGSGAYVLDQRNVRKPLELTSFTEDMHARGLVPTSRLLESVVEVAPAAVQRELGIGEVEVLRLGRLRLADGEPMALETTYLPLDRFRGIEELGGVDSLYAVLKERYKTEPVRARQRIRSLLITVDQAPLLAVQAGSAALEVTRTVFDRFGSAYEFGTSTYRGDRYEFDVAVEP